MLVQMCKVLGCEPIVAVVGATHKVQACKALGAHVVVDKSKEDLWSATKRAAPAGFAAVFDANGVETLDASYKALALTGTLVIYGFHTNLPSSAMLNPLAWARMALKIMRMPRFDPMDLVLASKSVCGFNLSFFADEVPLFQAYMKQIHEWLEHGDLEVPEVTTLAMENVPRAHQVLQSGQSIGKVVCLTTYK